MFKIYSPPGMEDDKPTLGIDFDGVLHNDNQGWNDGTCYGEPLEGAIEAIKKLVQDFRIVVFTAKVRKDRPLVNGKTGLELVREWLIKYDLLQCVSDITDVKPRAVLYIDDRGYRFENWEDTLSFISHFQNRESND